MAARGKASPLQLPTSPKTTSKNAAVLEDYLEPVVEAVMDRLFTRLKGDLITSVSDALADFRRAFDDRWKSVEETCKELAVHTEIQASARSAVIDHLRDRVCELEFALARNELNCNLVLSGVDKTLQSPKNTTDVVLQTCRDVLNK